jgi:hypothetical protein
MTLHPAVIALFCSSALITLMVLYASYFALRVLRRWDLRSGSELQLGLERRTYLVSTVLGYAFVFELVSLFLFVFTAEDLHAMFVGAMCAAGTLNATPLGYPALIAKAAVFLLAGVWLILNHADNQAPDYPLIRIKYALLLFIAPVSLLETTLQAGHLLGLRADVITSCCGTLFSTGAGGADSAAAWAGDIGVERFFYPAVSLVFISGVYYYLRQRGGYVFSMLSLAALPVSVLALIYHVSPYIYELPSHCCPFCILKGEYNHIGYPLYLSLLGGSVAGAGVGALMPFRGVESLREAAPALGRRLALVSLGMYLVFAALVAWSMLASNLITD